jgi:hypothetical protein
VELAESFKAARQTLWAHKLRAMLTALGIIIGVASVIGLLAIVAGIRDSVSRQFSSLGAEMISINRWDWGGGNDQEDYAKRKPLTLVEYEAVKALPAVDIASPTVYTGQELRFRNTRMGGVTICGTDDVYPAIENWTVQEGRFLSIDDVRSAREVAVLGADVANNLFPGGGGTDQDIRIGGPPLPRHRRAGEERQHLRPISRRDRRRPVHDVREALGHQQPARRQHLGDGRQRGAACKRRWTRSASRCAVSATCRKTRPTTSRSTPRSGSSKSSAASPTASSWSWC